MSFKGYLVPYLKDGFIFAGWVAGLLLIGALSWFFTRTIRAEFLQDSINSALIRMEDPRRLEAPLVPGTIRSRKDYGPLSPQGYWFSLKGEVDCFLFFTLIADGLFLPCGAILSPEGKVKELIPMSIRGEKTLAQVPPGVIRLYIRRIEGEP